MGHHHSHSHSPSKANNNLAIISTYCSIVSVLIIILVKLSGWLKTDSMSILASLVDSLLDCFTSVINMVALKYALQPPDDQHRFGHNKAEDLAGFIQAAFFGVSGIFVLGSCVKRIFYPQAISHDKIGLIVMIISTIITLCLVLFQLYVLRKTSSNIIEADHLHYKSDLFLNISVIISILASRYFNSELIDPILALFISLYIMKGAWDLLKKSFKNLMDEEFDEEEKQKIMNVINAHEKILSIHDLKTRYAGSKPFIQFHLVMNPDMNLRDAHILSDEIELSLLEIFPDAEIFIHQDPDGYDR
ncbi:Ferrous-iron efflux pump FieF [Candidatus Arcanobacter lacustris]|jgi:cation diffusion facilitator family transporter|uniref:Protein p34 n=1 Tax=Candidatus Arcanibacter lacustris TaxID=1607817 RepID=A0A0F5MMW3_9RICK|nr:Ferrous-iron efflux pump FieF [Candidatus Arcanobacter lacustris]